MALLAASIQRVWPRVIALYKFLWHLRPTLDPIFFARIFQRFIVLLKFFRSKWRTWYGKQKPLKPPSSPRSSNGVEPDDRASEQLKEADATNIDLVLPLDNVSYSLYPYHTGLHDASRSSPTLLNASRSSHNLGIISRSRNTSWSSHNTGLSNAQSPLGGGYPFTIESTSPYSAEFVPPDLHDTQRHFGILPQIVPQPRSDSPIESMQLLSLREISSSPIHIPPTSGPLNEQSTELGAVGTASQIYISYDDDPEIPPLDHQRIYPVVPENFQRYEKRRRM